MDKRLELHEKLCEILGSRNVYFQPPPSLQMKYPCIVYGRSSTDVKHGDDHGYSLRWAYSIIVIDREPLNPALEVFARMPLCRFDRHYTQDNLNHDVYTLYH